MRGASWPLSSTGSRGWGWSFTSTSIWRSSACSPGGPKPGTGIIDLAKTTPILILDVVLIFGLLFHALNGLRLTLVSLNMGVRRQTALFWGAALVTVVLDRRRRLDDLPHVMGTGG